MLHALSTGLGRRVCRYDIRLRRPTRKYFLRGLDFDIGINSSNSSQVSDTYIQVDAISRDED